VVSFTPRPPYADSHEHKTGRVPELRRNLCRPVPILTELHLRQHSPAWPHRQALSGRVGSARLASSRLKNATELVAVDKTNKKQTGRSKNKPTIIIILLDGCILPAPFPFIRLNR
jgi:hypothetical protein